MLVGTIDSNRPVLIVDDSPMYRTAAKGMLQRLGYPIQRIDFAQDASEAKDKCRANNYALVLFDYNLGKKANGYQLIDELQHKQLLCPDCVMIIVTGDGTPEVVRGFMELEPDGYLLKPLNYATLQTRLPQFSAKKRHLSDLLTVYGNKHYEAAISHVDETFYKDEDIIVKSQLIKAKALAELERYDESRNVLINLKGSSDNSTVQLELARITFLQRQYKQALFLASQVKKDPLRSARAFDLCAEIYTAQHQFDSAQEEIESAISISPKRHERHEVRVSTQLALFDLISATASLKALQTESRNSFRESVDYYLLQASIQLDLALFDSPSQRESHIGSVAKLIEQWRQLYTREQYKGFELLILSRVFKIKSDFHKSRQYFDSYMRHKKESEDYQPSLFESIELAKAAFAAHDDTTYKQAVEDVVTLLDSYPNKAAQNGFASYFQQYRTKCEQGEIHLEKIKERTKQYQAQQHFDKAAILLSKAIKTNTIDSEICLLMLEVLTRSWPPAWTRVQVAKIAMICKEHLKGSPQSKSQAYIKICDTLASQLDFKELKETAPTSV
ncbi:response regulator [Vibrio sp. TBV020]|uniref:response regulator n=1 Tax=Vibrio sp. TBV020 TaxID=3137398 RepID=UPI0038CDA439